MRFVLFDLGGVLFDFDHRIALRALAARSRAGEAEFEALIFGAGGLEPAYDAGQLTTKDLVWELQHKAGYGGDEASFREDWGNIFARKDDTWAIVDRLSAAGVPLGIVSNTNEAHFEFLASKVDFIARFRWVFLSFRLRHRKPEPAFYDWVASHIPFAPGEGLFVDDRPENLLPAAAAGFAIHRFCGAEGLEQILTEG